MNFYWCLEAVVGLYGGGSSIKTCVEADKERILRLGFPPGGAGVRKEGRETSRSDPKLQEQETNELFNCQ